MKITPFFKTVQSEFQSMEDPRQTSWVGTAPCMGGCQAASAQGGWGPPVMRVVSPSAQPAVTVSVLPPQQCSSGSFSFPAGMQSPHLQGIKISKLHKSGPHFQALRRVSARGLSGRCTRPGAGPRPPGTLAASPQPGPRIPHCPGYSRARAGSAGQGTVTFPTVFVSSFPAARLPLLCD